MRNFNHLSNNHGRFVRWPSVVAFVAVMHLTPSVAAAQSWNYQAYSSRDGRPTAPGYITLDETSGKPIFRIAAGTLINCYQGNLDAMVTRSETTTIITVAPRLLGCNEIRFVIKNDGTGGQREVKSGAAWVWDGLDRRLTPRK